MRVTNSGHKFAKKVAVITDATSASYWFPKWHRYYATQFGPNALYVVTYKRQHLEFRNFNLGGVWEVPGQYEDALRSPLISSLVAALLLTYDVVIRCDVDEFLIPDLRLYENLSDYVNRCDLPYVTAYGIDIFEKEGDASLDMDQPVLVSQRGHGIISSALHKTALTTIPLDWALGFHGVNSPPVLDALYMFHMKFADIDGRSAWMEKMRSEVLTDGSEYSYFSFSLAQMRDHKAWLSGKQCSPLGWPSLLNEEDRRIFDASIQVDLAGVYAGTFNTSENTFVIPKEFRDIA